MSSTANLTIEVRHFQRGQPRPYADHIYSSEITCFAEQKYYLPSKDQMKDLVKAVVRNYVNDEHENWALPRLKALNKIREVEKDGVHKAVWFVQIEEAYTG
jgi:hypothetical protein